MATSTEKGSESAIVMEKDIETEEMTSFEVHHTTLQVGDTTFQTTTAVGLHMEEKTHEEIELVETEHGMVARRVTRKQIHVRRVMMTNLYIEAKANENEAEEDDVEVTCGEKCTDICCQSTTCNFSNPFQRGGTRRIEATELMTDTLRRGRAKGWSMYYSTVFPLFRPAIRDTWVTVELILALIGLVLSIATVSLDQNRVFNILHLCLVILSGILALLDGILTLKQCESCKICCSKTKVAPANSTEKVDPSGSEDSGAESEETECCYGSNFYSNCKNASDIIRIVLTEMLLYPLLICDMFEVITERGYQGKTPGDRLGFALFILSCGSFILYNYVVRLLTLVGMIKSVQEARTPSKDEFTNREQSNYDPSIKTSALSFQIYFFVHAFLQMLAQALMLIAIGGKIRYDNRHFYSASDINSIHVSGTLWYMIVAGYFLPLMGFLTFFLVTHYWTQEFPIGLCIDMISIWKMGNPDDFVYIDEKQKVKKSTVIKVIDQFVRITKLRSEFHNMRHTFCCEKFFYPFKAPVLILISVGYITLHLAFVVCSAVTLNDMGTTVSQILNGGGWAFYYIVEVVVAVLANVYVFAVAALWIGVVALIITIIAIMIASFLVVVGCLILLAVCVGMANIDDD